jgi:NADH-quinone oxidoreductase subunit L
MAYISPHGSRIFWLIGVITAFITSFYMFRLWFMTFFGEYRGGPATHDVTHQSADAHDMHDKHDQHGHAHGEPHESPWVMLGPLVVLAILSFAGGWVGIHHKFDLFLTPVFQSHAHVEFRLITGPEAAASEEKIAAMDKLELMLTGVSVAAGVLGLYLAWLLYYRRRDLPDKIAARLGDLYQAVVNKYYVDELYASLFVKPLVEGSTAILWKGVDQGMIDATVNNAASEARHVSDNVRHMQSGNLRSYAGWIAAGGAAVIAYMVWMGVR